MLWNLLTAGIFGTDYYIKKKINTSEKKDLKEKCLGGRLIVRNCHNHGMMLGILKNKDKEFLRDLASMVLGGAIWEYIRTFGEKGTRISKLGLSMILGGGLNNYTERRRKGYVTDYVSLNVKKKEILKGILGHCTDRVFIESPVHMSYGNHVHLGDQFYANFNLVIIDDMDVYIGNQVMIGPNVTICTTGHPVYPLYREMGAHYSLPIHIGNKVWIGANSVVLPGVTIGDNSVIGAGSIVTRDIPANVVAVGNPCRVLREITETDREYYFRDMKVDFPYTLREEG